MMANPLVSIIIPTYNRAQYICETIDSVLEQSYKNIEIIVIDDGSTDNTRDILEKYGSKISYIYQNNAGPSSARNNGIKRSKGELLAFLDSDDIWLPDKLDHQVKLMEQLQDIGLVGCGCYHINTSGEIVSAPIVRKYNNKEILKKLLIRNVISGGTSGAMIKRECFDKVGMFYEDLWIGEDRDLWIRIARHYDIGFIEKPLLKIRVHNKNLHTDTRKLETDMKKIIERNIEKWHFITKRKAYSYSYMDLAWEHMNAGNGKSAIKNIIKSIINYPFKAYDTDGKYKILCKLIMSSYMFNFFRTLYKKIT